MPPFCDAVGAEAASLRRGLRELGFADAADPVFASGVGGLVELRDALIDDMGDQLASSEFFSAAMEAISDYCRTLLLDLGYVPDDAKVIDA
jgi:hypothetical protein